MSCQPGDTLGNFQLIKELGRGATGTVFLAEQTNLGRECALKVLAPELVRDQSFLDRFQREGKIAASLRHKNIVCIFDLVKAEPYYALAMDYINGQELKTFLEAEKKLPQKVALDIITNVLDALDYAHNKGIVHRDVKPANILIEPDGQVFLADFSIARLAGAEKLTKTGMVIGTPEYMAPEQFDGKEVDARADVYATSLILYEMLSGINPFCGDTLAEVIKKQVLVEPPSLGSLVDVSPGLVEIVHRGLAKSPDNRYQTAGEMREALLALGNPVKESAGSLTQFLQSVELGAVSMDAAVNAREKVKDAIDKSFKRRLTIVMLDLAGSSKIKIPNQTLIADRAFQDYRYTINQILEEYGVERYDWSGDGAISLFSDAINGVDAAVMVQRKVSEVGARHSSLPDSLKVRIGIRTGMVYYDPRRTLGQFASRTVDQAGHLEKDCPPGSIRLGDETVRCIGDRYHVVSKGVNRDDIEVFEIDVHSPENRDRRHAPDPSGSAQAGPPGSKAQHGETPVFEAKPAAPTKQPQPASVFDAPLEPLPAPTYRAPADPVPAPNPAAAAAPFWSATPSPLSTPPPEVKSVPAAPARSEATQAPPPLMERAPATRTDSGPANPPPVPKTFQPKEVKVIRPEPAPNAASEGRWWGWKTLGATFLAYSGAGLAYGAFGLDKMVFALLFVAFFFHMLALPVYAGYTFFTGQRRRTLEVVIAGTVYFVLSFFMLGIISQLGFEGNQTQPNTVWHSSDY